MTHELDGAAGVCREVAGMSKADVFAPAAKEELVYIYEAQGAYDEGLHDTLLAMYKVEAIVRTRYATEPFRQRRA